MDIEAVRRHIRDWVENTLSIPSPVFNNLPPCPYSREALAKNRVDIRCVQGSSLLTTIAEIGKAWDDSHTLILTACEPATIAAEELTRGIAEMNRVFESADLICFCDHPDCTDAKYKVTSANGKYVLVGVQRLSNFIEAAKPLYKRKYFEGVSKQFSLTKNMSKLH